jgi:hypothetical protein
MSNVEVNTECKHGTRNPPSETFVGRGKEFPILSTEN